MRAHKLNKSKAVNTIVFLILLSIGVCSTIQAQDKPNIVFILADDLGWGDLSCYGHPYAKTPALDKLASEGIQFKRFYVTGTTCCPSRTGFMTSRHPASYPRYMAEYGFGDKTTITELLNQNGYTTGHFGKWHIGPKSDINPVLDGIYGIDKIGVIGSDHDSEGGRDEDLFEAATEFIENNKDKPFYVNIWGHITHYPVDPYSSLVDEFKDVVVKRSDFGQHMQKQFDDCEALGGDTLGGNIEQSMRNYMGDVLGLDKQVGRLLDKLDELGIAENTIVIFSSDQGPAPVIIPSHAAQGKYEITGKNTGVIPSQNMLGYAGGLRGGKHTQFEGGVRSPFIIRWPGEIPANVIDSSSITSALDFLPTLCNITGIDIDGSQFEGEIVTDVWKGNKRSRAKPLFWRASATGGDASMLDGNWKMHQNDNDYDLYDLLNDAEETNDVSDLYPEKVNELKSKMAEWVATLPNEYTKEPATEVVYTYRNDSAGNIDIELFQHFDASVDSTIDTDANNYVSLWKDKSGNRFDATSGDGNAIFPSSKTFPNGLNGIDLRDANITLNLLTSEASDTLLNQAANPTGFCFITALYIDEIAGNWNDILGNNTSVSDGFFIRYSDVGKLQANLGGEKVNGSKEISPGQAAIFSFDYDVENGVYHYWSSASDEELIQQIAPGDFSNNSPLSFGATNGSGRFFDGIVGEIQVYATSIPKAQRKEIIYQLGQKWGVDLPRIPQKPNTRIVSTKYSDDDVAIIQFNAVEAPYNADKTGVLDATQAIQDALDDCANAPGGVVYLPEGIYRIDGNLVMDDGVILRGDWKEPTNNDKTLAGTILHIYSSRGEDSDDVNVQSPILVGASGGIRDLSIFYPEQNAANPIPYPYTIRCKSKMQTVMNVTLVNSYKGIRYETSSNAAVGHPNVYNVYGSPIKRGVRLNKAAAVPRLNKVDFAPAYWAESGLAGAPSETEILSAQRSLQSIALEFEQSDNGIVGDVHLKGYDIAIAFGLGGQSSNMKVYDFNIENCRVGIRAAQYKSQGWTFTKGKIQVDGEGAMGVYQSWNGTLTFNDVGFESTDKLVVSTNGSLSFTNCRFTNWQDGYGIQMSNGNLICFGNTFSKTLEQDQAHIYLSSGVEAAAISGNYFENSVAKITTLNKDTNRIVIDTIGNYDVYRHNYPEYDFGEFYKPNKQEPGSLFNVIDYGAVGDMETENTSAFKAALTAAEQNGGGTVYIPGGAYRIDGRLTVPSGVELRGIHDLPVYTGHGRSILLSYLDKSNPGDSAFITLEQEASVRGLVVIRPQQTYNEKESDVGTTIYNWPYAIEAVGDNCSIINTAVANADKGINLSSLGGGHYLNFYMTAPIRNCLNVQTGANSIVVENMQTNPGLFRDIAKTLNWNLFTDNTALAAYFINKIAPNADESQDLYPSGTAVNILGDGALTFYSNFYNNPFNGFIINGSPTVKSYLSGGEGEVFYSVQSEGNGPIDLEIIANTYHPIETDPAITGFGSFNLNPDSEGIVKILNTTSFSNPNVGYRINNGKLIIQSAFQTVPLQTFVEAKGSATVSVEGSFLRNGMTVFHGTALNDSIDFEILGTYSPNTYRVSSTVNVSGSTPLATNKIDVLNPSQPIGLVAKTLSSSQIELNWNSSTDNVGIKGYEVFRDGIKVAFISSTNYTDEGLDGGTQYSYYVVASDDANNQSKASDTVNVSTLTVGLDRQFQNNEISIYPNPAHDRLFISLPAMNSKEIAFKVHSVSGQLIYYKTLLNANLSSETELDISSLKEGLYIYKLFNTEINLSGKLYIDKN